MATVRQPRWEYEDMLVPLNVQCPAEPDVATQREVTALSDWFVARALRRAERAGWYAVGAVDAGSLWAARRLTRGDTPHGFVFESAALLMRRRVWE
jgi:hypothetical protein